MKLRYLRLLSVALGMMVLSLGVNAQDKPTKPSTLVLSAKKHNTPTSFELFDLSTTRSSTDIPKEITNYSLLTLDRVAIKKLLETDEKFIKISIPQQDRSTLSLELVEVNIFADDFKITLAPSNTTIKAPLGRHYRGIIKDQKLSVVSLSVFENEVSAIISHPYSVGNLVMGKLANSTAHILYQDDQIKHLNETSCSTPDGQIKYTNEELRGAQINSRSLADCVRLYLEVDNDIYINKGSNTTTVTSYITGLFNQVATLYANEQINTVVSEIVIWNQASPYNSTTSLGMLNAFTANRQGFNGDLAQLLSYKASGGIAYVDGLCRSNPDYSMSYAGINSTYQTVPTYSWSVEVCTHEFGHLFGSQHTHACAWNGNNTALDGCYAVEGSCGNPGLPPAGTGTIMSYCHLTSVGINFSNGFGSQPGNIIRNKVTNAGCLTACSGDGDGGGGNPCTENELTLNVRTDNYPGETTWSIKNAANAVVYSGGPYSGPNTLYPIALCLPVGCFTFTINDSYGDGICCNYGQGYFNVKQGTTTLLSGAQFTNTKSIQFCVTNNNAPSCSDGIKNGNETGIDCGGSCAPCATCNDGIKNGNETGIDCGGSCTPCSSCNDGIKNGNETGIDCGGSCAPCATCNDGIKNGNETGVDCGGSCPACPTCSDGIRNGNETGVDCGGSCPACNTGGGNVVVTTIAGNYFETGWDGWLDGGSDCSRYNGTLSPEGNYSIKLRDNTDIESAMSSQNFNLSTYDSITFEFKFRAVGMETNKKFLLKYFNGTIWATHTTYTSGTDFSNDVVTTKKIKISANLASNAAFRIQCDAADNSDAIYVDAVVIKGYKTTGAPAPTCNDGIKNGNETGIDCGGSCAPCASCNDGIKNGNETGIDCGGSCAACPTCNDGIKNGNETGVDCGGSCTACPSGGSIALSAHYFETGWDGWIDGGGDVFRYNGTLSPEGNYAIRIRDNSGEQSAMTSQSYNLSTYQTVTVEFKFRAEGMESGKDFWLLFNNGNNTWINVATFVSGTNFVNDVIYTTTVTLVGNFSSNSQFRFQCDADSNEDNVYIDAVIISASTTASLIADPVVITALTKASAEVATEDTGIILTPNPVNNDLYLRSEEEIQKVVIYTTAGSIIDTWSASENFTILDVSNLNSGLYLIQITTIDDITTKKFIKN